MIEKMKVLNIAYENGEVFPTIESKPVSRTIFMCKERFDYVMDNPWCIKEDYPEIVAVLSLEYENLINNILIKEEWDTMNQWDGENEVDWINM